MTTPELVEQVENSELVYMLDRMKAIQEREHNPMGIALQRFGPAVAIASREMPWPQFNTVKGFGFAGTAQLDEVLKWYKEQGGSPQFEIVPSRIDGETLLALAKQGFYQSGFHASMAGSIAEQAGMRSEEGHTGVVVRRLGEHEVDLYAELHALGSGLPIAGKTTLRIITACCSTGKAGSFMLLRLIISLLGLASCIYMNISLPLHLPQHCRSIASEVFKRR